MPLAVSFSDPSPSEPWVCTVLEYYQVTREVHRYRLLQVEVCYPFFEIFNFPPSQTYFCLEYIPGNGEWGVGDQDPLDQHVFLGELLHL